MDHLKTLHRLPSHDDVSQRIAESIPIILDRWEARVRGELPAAQQQGAPELRDHLPDLLLELTGALAATDEKGANGTGLRLSREHGEARAQQAGYSLSQILAEYRLLRQTTLEVLEREPGLSAREREIVTDTIERAMQEAAAQFVRSGQEALRSMEASHRATLHAALDGVVVIDHQGQVVDWNPAAEMMFGFSHAEAVGRPLAELIIPPKLREPHRAGLARLLATGEGSILGQRVELTAVHATGREFPVELTITRVLTAGPPMLTGFVRDITERKQTEERVASALAREQAARAEAERTAEALRRAQIVTDVALANLRFDEMLDALLARVSEAFRADTATLLLLEGDQLVVRAALGREAGARQGFRVPLGQGFAGGIAVSRQPVLIENLSPEELSPILSPLLRELKSLLGVPLLLAGETLGVLHIGSLQPYQFGEADVRLMQHVADRAAIAIDRARLLHELQAANERKTEFLTMVAHELRTPLSAITSALYILENIVVPDELAARQIGTANRQTRQLARLVQDLMDINRITRGQIDLRREPVALCRVTREAAEAVRSLMESRGQGFHCSIPTEELLIHGDADRLEQILTNLLSNAAKYTEPGGQITLTVERRESEAVVRVKDTGIGIDPPMLPQVFDMFHQVEPAAARSQGGLGIGLALVKRLVELHGGSVTADSTGLGQGTEFTVRLPLAVGVTRTEVSDE